MAVATIMLLPLAVVMQSIVRVIFDMLQHSRRRITSMTSLVPPMHERAFENAL